MSSVYLEELAEKGYTIVRNVLTASEVEKARDILDKLDSPLSAIVPSEVLSMPLLNTVPFKEKVISAFKGIFGGAYVVYPNFTVRQNVYVPWHLDVAFHNEVGGIGDKPNFLQCAIYLQDNNNDGGIDVIPGSHKRIKINGQYYTPSENLDVFSRSKTVDSRAGDLVLFDGRTLHASSGNGVSNQSSKKKYGLFFTASSFNANKEQMLQHLFNRKDVKKVTGEIVKDPRFEDMKTLEFPVSYPEVAIKAAENGDIHFLTLKDITNNTQTLQEV
ncbi:phytanoyl-CoA dioxygenase family protein [Bacillus cereus group sp. BfR-BA-01380]|uniref:phytanoyl-CoA dioxygenase family protein n=1 Tax=Bacillus cereus group sp. BfR-BA-01380 TaxID=2920324 RepID=UPI001F580AEC|nr:phytanoyl-CoA dioxygenase family protein [Bacillus cereus group sp. BfR-BA-01380]